jgi:zinc transport system substrate-binding protein
MVSIAGLSPEAEPSARDLADLTDLLREKSTKYVLVETLVSPKIGETLAREVGAQTLVLNPLEGLDAGEIREGKNYVSVMRENLKNLQIAMDCR